jgi:peptide/nickel transport system ATP-binding protein
MVFQNPQSALNPRRRVGSIVTQSLERNLVPAAQREAQARMLLGEVGLEPEYATRFPDQLSGGQKQRINIARAIGARPRVLVADEIVSGLDVSVQAQILNLLLRLRAEFGFGLLFISHDLAVVRFLCERIVIMKGGCIVEEGPTERVFRSPEHAYTRSLLAASPPDEPDAEWTPANETTA